MTTPSRLIPSIFAPRRSFGRARGATESTVELIGYLPSTQGSAFGLCAISVMEVDGHYVPAGPGRVRLPISKATWLSTQVSPDSRKRFTVQVPRSLWIGVEGVLMVLLFDADLGFGNFSQRFQVLRQSYSNLPLAAFVSLETLVELPEDDAQKIEEALNRLLQGRSVDLRPGLATI